MKIGLIASACILLGAAVPAGAAVTIDIYEQGGNVEFRMNGSLNLDGLIYEGLYAYPDGLNSSGAYVKAGGGGMLADGYSNLTGPTSFGGFSFVGPSRIESSGDLFGVHAEGSLNNPRRFGFLFYVSRDYQSGQSISNSMTFFDSTFANQGLAPGIYVFQAPNDSVTVRVGEVPEPATWSMMIVGFALAGVALRRRTPVVAA